MQKDHKRINYNKKKRYDNKQKIQFNKQQVDNCDQTIQGLSINALQNFLENQYDKKVNEKNEHLVQKAIIKRISQIKEQFLKKSIQKCILLFKTYFNKNIQDKVILKLINQHFPIEKYYPDSKHKQANINALKQQYSYHLSTKNYKQSTYLLIAFHYKKQNQKIVKVYCGKKQDNIDDPSYKRLRKQGLEVLQKLNQLSTQINSVENGELQI